MAPQISHANSGSAEHDDLNELFDFETALDDIFDSINDGNNTPNGETRASGNDRLDRAPEAVNLDEEIKIAKQRKPIAKLDETRLTSNFGIPKLQKISKRGLKFRGKNHEFSDVALLLRTYQLWLDDLYPRAKFADGLKIIEGLGRANSMRRLRSDWINESKTKLIDEDDFDITNLSATAKPGAEREPTTEISERPDSNMEVDFPVASIRAASEDIHRHPSSPVTQTNGEGRSRTTEAQAMQGAPDEDELDALLSEETPQSHVQTSSTNTAFPDILTVGAEEEDPFADEEEMMREIEGWP